jgi:prevent-host-death family protein
MAQFNIHEAKTNLSRLVGMAQRGEEVILSKHGKPIAQIVPIERRGLVLGSAVDDPNINRAALERDDWWQPMTEEETEAFIEGRE